MTGAYTVMNRSYTVYTDSDSMSSKDEKNTQRHHHFYCCSLSHYRAWLTLNYHCCEQHRRTDDSWFDYSDGYLRSVSKSMTREKTDS